MHGNITYWFDFWANLVTSLLLLQSSMVHHSDKVVVPVVTKFRRQCSS